MVLNEADACMYLMFVVEVVCGRNDVKIYIQNFITDNFTENYYMLAEDIF